MGLGQSSLQTKFIRTNLLILAFNFIHRLFNACDWWKNRHSRRVSSSWSLWHRNIRMVQIPNSPTVQTCLLVCRLESLLTWRVWQRKPHCSNRCNHQTRCLTNRKDKFSFGRENWNNHRRPRSRKHNSPKIRPCNSWRRNLSQRASISCNWRDCGRQSHNCKFRNASVSKHGKPL